MYVRIITMRFSEGIQGFPEDVLRQATLGREVLKAETNFFTHGDIPYISMVLHLADMTDGESEKTRAKNLMDARKKEAQNVMILPEAHRKAYQALKEWRNDKIKTLGLSSATIGRNPQLFSLAIAAPQTIAAMKEVDGITESFCSKYGHEILPLFKGLTPVQIEQKDGGESPKEKDGKPSPADNSSSGDGAEKKIVTEDSPSA